MKPVFSIALLLLAAALLGTRSSAVMTPLAGHREAEAYESLRDASDTWLADHGTRPRVFLANMGPIPEHKPRATFATGFFEAGGIEAPGNEGFETTELALEAAHFLLDPGAATDFFAPHGGDRPPFDLGDRRRDADHDLRTGEPADPDALQQEIHGVEVADAYFQLLAHLRFAHCLVPFVSCDASSGQPPLGQSDLVGQLLDVVRSAERLGDVRDELVVAWIEEKFLLIIAKDLVGRRISILKAKAEFIAESLPQLPGHRSKKIRFARAGSA